MSEPVTAESFWCAFEPQIKKEVRAAPERFKEICDSNPLWTQLVMRALRNTGAQLGHPEDRIWTEYYRLDMPWFCYPEKDFPHTDI